MKEQLSRVYLDDYPITLMGDEAAPPLSRIIRAGGKHPDRVDVVYLTAPSDRQGRPVPPDEIIDRTVEPTRPIYLRTIPRAAKPIRTVDPAAPPPGPVDPPVPPMPNVDPVIEQLGRRARSERPRHKEAIFRSPSQQAADEPARTAKALRRARQAESQAAAESEAEQRQEDERNLEDSIRDEQEAEQDSDDDRQS